MLNRYHYYSQHNHHHIIIISDQDKDNQNNDDDDNQVAAKEGVVRLRAGQDYTLRSAPTKQIRQIHHHHRRHHHHPHHHHDVLLRISCLSFKFRCSAHGQPNPRIMWTKTVFIYFCIFIHQCLCIKIDTYEN